MRLFRDAATLLSEVNQMKKIITGMFAIILIATFFAPFSVFGESSNPITISHNLDAETNQLEISGTVASNKGAVPLFLMITREGALFAADIIESGDSENGVSGFSFEPIPFPGHTQSGDYTIYISASHIKAYNTAIFNYKGIDLRYNLIAAVNVGIRAQETAEDAVLQAISDGRETLSIDGTVFDGLSPDAKKKLAKLIISNGEYSLPDGYDTPEKVELINTSFKELAVDYNTALVIAKAVDINTKEKLNAFILENGGDTFYDNDETKLKAYVEKATLNTEFFDNFKDLAKGSSSLAEFKDNLFKSALMYLIENGRYADIQEIVTAVPEIFTINTSKLLSLSNQQILEIYMSMTELTFTDVDDFISKFNSAIDAKSQVINYGSSTSDRSPSRGGTSSGSISVGDSVQSTPSTENQEKFSDLPESHWASEAVSYLAGKNIISGRDNGTFDPQANITRAEFLKIVVNALNIPSADYNGQFADVSKDAWYASYVSSAHLKGIITGDGGYFNPNSPVTRQDMAVILYRAISDKSASQMRDVFHDSDDISNYAKEAIFYMYENGIINGRGDGMFVPKGTATRAEAAQMIYKFIK